MPGLARIAKQALTVLALAALLPTLLTGCYGGRASVPAPVQRTPEAEGRKARLEREAAQAPAQVAAGAEVQPASEPAPEPAPALAAAPEAKPEAKPEARTDAKPEPAPAPPATTKAETYAAPALSAETPAKELTLQGQYVQIASFGAEKNAENAVAWLKANGFESSRVVRVEQAGVTLHRVQAGPFQDPAAARGALDALKAQWPQAFIPAD